MSYNNYYNILNNKYSSLLNNIIDKYYSNNINQQILTYFRLFFIYYIMTSYIYKPEISIQEIKIIFFKWFENTVKSKYKQQILKNIQQHYNYLFSVFFINKNCYFHTYFNNLIKYFLPVPFEYSLYAPFLVFRTNVSTLYKTNNFDYLDTINKFDSNNSFSMKYNIDEIDMHIPFSFFNSKYFNDFDIIYLVGNNEYLYICDKHFLILYSRKIDLNNNLNKYLELFLKKKSLEEIFPFWISDNSQPKIKININQMNYICVMKKYNSNDLFNVFNKYELNLNTYSYLFHNSFYNDIKSIDLNKPTFYYLIPSSKSKYFDSEAPRNCFIFKIVNNINNLLDLTSSIITNNPFTYNLIDFDKNKKKWISYDPSKVLDFYDFESIPTIFHSNFKCLTLSKKNYDRIYCDVYNYSGRTKMQEIFFKTRKYKYKKIYFNYKNDHKINNSDKYKMYHPVNTHIFQTWDFDTFILKMLKVNGFFFIDFGDALDGGELLLLNPNNFLQFHSFSDKPCYKK